MNARRPMKMVQKISFLCCQFCSYKTRFTGNLAKHIRTHTGERPFECQFCGKRFASKSNYNTHVVIHSSFGTPLKFPFGEKSVSLHTRVKCEPSNRTLTSSVNSEVVRSVPMVKTLLSSSRSSSRSAVQKLSPIGSFLTPNQGNASFSHSALYSPLSFSPFGSSQPCRKDCFVEDATETSFTDHPVNFLNNEGSNIDSSVTSPEAIETTNLEIEENRSLIEDVKPTIFDILSALPETDRASFAKKVRDSHLFASIKEEAADRVPYVQNSNHVRSGRTRRSNSNCSDRKSIDDLDIKDLNGHCSGYGVPCALGRLEDDPRELRAQMLVDSLIKDSRLFRCDSCNILFPEYGMYVLHLGCHGSEGAYQCHFCRRFFDDKFGFATHFVRCPHEPSDSH